MNALNQPTDNAGKASNPTGGNALLIAIGNSSRGDDGLGWAFAEALEQEGGFPGEIILRYQLQVEDAELISRYDRVFFADACQGDLPEGFLCKKCRPENDVSFTTHRLAPETVLYLCRELYQKQPEACLLLIKGEKWELGAGLSAGAGRNLKKCLAFFRKLAHPALPLLKS